MVRYTAHFRGKMFWIRDLEERDVEAIVSYWHKSPPSFLRSLGVDLSKLKLPQDTRRLFLGSLAATGSSRSRATFVVVSEDELIAYTNVNIRSQDEAYGHFHILKDSLSARALAYFLFPSAIQVFFKTLPLSRVLFQTSPENRNINRMLASFGLKPQRIHLESPDGMARPGAFNLYEISRENAARISRLSGRDTAHESRHARR